MEKTIQAKGEISDHGEKMGCEFVKANLFNDI